MRNVIDLKYAVLGHWQKQYIHQKKDD